MSPVQHNSSGTTQSPLRRAPPLSQKTISVLIGICVFTGVTVLAIIILALLRCYLQGRKSKLALQATTSDPRSPRDSFIQFPPRPVERPGEESDHHFTPSPSFSLNTDRQEHLNGVMTWTAAVTPKQSREFGTGTSSLCMTNIAQSESGNTLLETNPVTDSPNRAERSNSTHSTESLSPLHISGLQTQSGQPLRTCPCLAIPVSPKVTQTEVYPGPRPLQRPLMKVADVETMSLGSASNVTQSRQSRPFGLRPGLPSSPAASLARSPLTSVVVPSPHITASFLDSPPKKKLSFDPRDRGHLRSRSHSSILPRDVEKVRSPKGAPDLMLSPSYTSVPYAVEGASETSRSQARSLTLVSAIVRAPHPNAIPKAKDHTSMETYSRKSDIGSCSLLSSRTRSRARSHNWLETGKEAPKWI